LKLLRGSLHQGTGQFDRVLQPWILLMLLVAQPASAQELSPGSTVRFQRQSSDSVVIGTVQSLSPDTLRVFDSRSGIAYSLAFPSLARLEVRQPRSRGQGAIRGAAWGAAVGAAVGVASCLVDMDSCRSRQDGGEVEGTLEVAMFTGVLGFLPGAALGAILPGRRWRTARRP
jgi:hypothetical protein